MPLDPPQLPTKFPCWCQAIYSWGGETKKDLGFVEGDLIECLNAGDGAWWMGRLRRDQRMVGLFPSNFVRVLSEDFAPEKTRKLSTNDQQPPAKPPQKQKTIFRKPFQGYKEAVGPSEALRQKKEEAIRTSALHAVRKRSGTHPSRPASKQISRRSVSPAAAAAAAAAAPAPAPAPARAISPAPHPSHIPQPVAVHSTRAQSPAPATALAPASKVPHHQTIASSTTYAHPPPPYPPSPFSGASSRSPLPLSFLPQPLRPPSPALSPSRSPVHKPSQSLQIQPTNAPYNHASNQYSRNELFHRQNSRKRSGSFPTVRHDQPRSRPSLHPISTRLPPPEPLAPATPDNRAPSPNSIFARVPTPIEQSYMSAGPTYTSSYPGNQSLVSYVDSGIDYADEEDISPPPPPPPHRHRVAMNQPDRMGAPDSSALVVRAGGNQSRYDSNLRTPSPNVERKSAEYSNTPSPLRDAMEDVMSSLQDMGLPRDTARSPEISPDPYQPWSSEEFDRGQDSSRPTTSGGRPSTRDSWKAGNGGNTSYMSNNNSFDRYQEGPPQLNNYVQRMESRLRQLHAQNSRKGSDELHLPRDGAASAGTAAEAEDTLPPLPSTLRQSHMYSLQDPSTVASKMTKRRSAFDVIGRTPTTTSNATNSSSGKQSTITNSSTSTAGHSLMSGTSAGAYSATSAGSYARRGGGGGFGTFSSRRPSTSMDLHHRQSQIISRPTTPSTGISYHSSHNTSRQGATSAFGWSDYSYSVAPSVSSAADSEKATKDPLKKKSGFFRKMIESAKSSAANARGTIGTSGGSSSPSKSRIGSAFSQRRLGTRASTRDVGNAAAADWIQVRRDVNRAMTPSKLEMIEKAERCQMMDFPVIYAIEDLYTTVEGDEGIDGLPIEEPTNWNTMNLRLVDKSTRFLSNIPSTLSPAILAQSYVCRSHRTDAQRLRAIFTWVAEKIIWDEDVDEEVDVRRVIHMRRGSSREVAVLVQEMCSAIGIHSEVVEGYLKTPGEDLDLDCLSRPNHWWNTVLIDGEWRIMDCSLASPTHPGRSLYSNTTQEAESWYFLARPLEICYSHVPLVAEQQHMVPFIATDVLLALPAVTPAYFKCGLTFPSYDTSCMRIDGLEAVQIRVEAPFDIECAAEVETQAFSRDVDGDYSENGEVMVKRALAQPDWCQGRKRYTIKAILPENEDRGVLKVYAGKRGLMHSSKDIPYPLAFAIPITHAGDNPPYDFVLRHPTPHAQQRDLYIVQPQCSKLAINNTFVFTVRQHPASLFPSLPSISNDGGSSYRTTSPHFVRPASSLSMVSSLAQHSNSSSSSYSQQPFSAASSNVSSNSSGSNNRKPAKLAIQSPSGKILRLTRKTETIVSASDQSPDPDGSLWETVIKVGEKGTWRALVLADRSNRWCVWAEWECN